MIDDSHKRPNSTRPRSKRDQYLSIESASLALAILLLANDKVRLTQLTDLAQRRPDILREVVKPLMGSFSAFEVPVFDENVILATKEELIEIVRPVLEDGTRLASFARIFDLYMLRNPVSPDGIVYVLYIIVRFCIARDSKPTAEQNKLIWSTVLSLTERSKIGGSHWRELEEAGEVYLNDWIRNVKENARKRFKTFISQKTRMEANADHAFRELFSLFFE